MNNHFLVIRLFLVFGLFLIESINSSTQNIKQTDDGIIIRLQDGDLKLQVCNERIIRVLYDPSAMFKPVESLVVIKDWQHVPFEVRDSQTDVEVNTKKVIVRINRHSGAISFYYLKGEVLFQENDIQPRVMTPARVMGEDAYHAQLNMKFSKNEAVYGLGQHQNALGTMTRYLNSYSLMATSGVYQGQRSVTSNKRACILTRSAFAGQQRNAAATWSGDIVADWKVFRYQISAGLNFCMSGIPYWSNDIGGFHVRRYGGFLDGCNDPGYRELYIRWFQYGAFNPIFRAHGTDTPREVWHFGEPGSWAYDALVKFLNLRYRLLPYIYSLAWKVTTDGYTMMRGLPMDFVDDNNVYHIDDQFMFGPALLINPVTDHMYYGEDYYNELIPVPQLFTEDGHRGGFTAQYFNGLNFDTLMVDSVQTELLFDIYLGKDLPSVVRWDKNSKRWSGWIKPETAGEYQFWITSDDVVRFWLDNKLLVDNWNDQGQDKTHRINSELETNRRYHFRLEQARMADATRLRLGWRTPEMKIQKLNLKKEAGARKLYLPQSSDWYDFWTGEKLAGGRIIERDVPIDIMPIYVRAGSIIPMGPHIQYADEKPADPIELRIYTGKDCQFELYEDEGDNYNYERGVYTIIPIQWDDKIEKLTIGERKGSFPGMLKERTFCVVWVGEDHGIGVEWEAYPDTTIFYKGDSIKLNTNFKKTIIFDHNKSFQKYNI